MHWENAQKILSRNNQVNKMESILRQATRSMGEPLNILSFATHERYQTSMSRCRQNFYILQIPGQKKWDEDYAKIPSNHTMLETNIPSYLDIDMVLSQSREYQFEGANKLANALGVPLINLQHTLPNPKWNDATLHEHQQRKGDVDVFVSPYSQKMWGGDETSHVNMTGIDLEIFNPGEEDRDGSVLTVANDFAKRGDELGFPLWVEITGFPEPLFKTKVLGKTPGLSKAANSIEELVLAYQTSSVYLNTTLVSTLPTVIIEAMACGLPIVSTKTCLIPETLVEHGINGFVSNDANELRNYCQLLLNDKEKAKKMGEMSRKKAEEGFSVGRFANKWDEIFRETANLRTM